MCDFFVEFGLLGSIACYETMFTNTLMMIMHMNLSFYLFVGRRDLTVQTIIASLPMVSVRTVSRFGKTDSSS